MKRSFSIGVLLGLLMFAAASASAQNCVPNANQIAVFENDNFQGRCKVINIGDFPSPQRMGFDNDSITSLKVGADVQVDVCGDDNYQGGCQTYGEDARTLVGTNIGNDSISSLRVYRKNAPAVIKPQPANTKPGNTNKMDVFGALDLVGTIDKIRGTWLGNSLDGKPRKYVFTNDGELFVLDPDGNYAYSRFIYSVRDSQNIEVLGNQFQVVKAKMTLKGDRLTLAWETTPARTTELRIESDTPAPNPGTGCGDRCAPIGNWVGVPGSPTAGERVSVLFDGGYDVHWLSSQNGGAWKLDKLGYWGGMSSANLKLSRTGSEELHKVSFSGDTMTLEENEVKKTYQRLKLPKK